MHYQNTYKWLTSSICLRSLWVKCSSIALPKDFLLLERAWRTAATRTINGPMTMEDGRERSSISLSLRFCSTSFFTSWEVCSAWIWDLTEKIEKTPFNEKSKNDWALSFHTSFLNRLTGAGSWRPSCVTPGVSRIRQHKPWEVWLLVSEHCGASLAAQLSLVHINSLKRASDRHRWTTSASQTGMDKRGTVKSLAQGVIIIIHGQRKQ